MAQGEHEVKQASAGASEPSYADADGRSVSVTGSALPMPYDQAHYCEGIGIFCGSIPAPAHFAEHSQPKVEVAVPFGAASGLATWHTPTGRRVTRRIREGHTSVLPAGMPHSGEWENEAEVLVFYLDPDFLWRAARESVAGGAVEVVEACTAEDALIRQLGLALHAELRQGGPAGRLYVESLVNVLAVHLLRNYTSEKLLRAAPRGLSEVQLRRTVDFIHDNLAGDLRLSEIARAADLSPYHFSRLFKQATGRTPHQYVVRCRVERAKRLLLRGDLAVAAVAFHVGFFDQSHFTRCFKRLTGVTPKTLLEENSKNIPNR